MWVGEDQTVNFDQSIQTDELQPDHFCHFANAYQRTDAMRCWLRAANRFSFSLRKLRHLLAK